MFSIKRTILGLGTNMSTIPASHNDLSLGHGMRELGIRRTIMIEIGGMSYHRPRPIVGSLASG